MAMDCKKWKDVKWHFSFNSLGFGLQIFVVRLAWQQFLNKI